MKAAILQSNYIPWVGYFSIIERVDNFVFYDSVQFTNNDWRNRNKVKSNDEAIWLTIPVAKQGRTSKTIVQTESTNNYWIEKHLKCIYHSYKKAKHFNQVYPEISRIYKTIDSPSISKINQHVIASLCMLLGINTKLMCSTNMNIAGTTNQRLIDICKNLGADAYISGPSAKQYIDQKLFKDNSIQLLWANYDKQLIRYRQVGDKFIPSLSILDLILNLGFSESLKYLRAV